ncbi:hypothetical protein VTO42DRAFT_1012 [Malbranchea cinnamomea]
MADVDEKQDQEHDGDNAMADSDHDEEGHRDHEMTLVERDEKPTEGRSDTDFKKEVADIILFQTDTPRNKRKLTYEGLRTSSWRRASRAKVVYTHAHGDDPKVVQDNQDDRFPKTGVPPDTQRLRFSDVADEEELWLHNRRT